MLEEVKNYLHADDADDTNIKALISIGHGVIEGHCGQFDYNENLRGRQLVKDYVRFAWNGVSEHFFDSFHNELVGLRLELFKPPDDVHEEELDA